MTATTEDRPRSRGFRIEGNLRDRSITIGRLGVFARIEARRLRWAWLALVKEGWSMEVVAGPAAVTLSWGIVRKTDKARVWAWRRAVSRA
ncbi:hypothetical protein GXW78_26525 [Roseomonas terrae]|uniref:Uncharacterized protein n=1 Tax=Neoroseomonas terrae TaxID=424799 RepID=A0ABS5EQF8_9PROT|nr:hypothetical protein [Neoroseomonas terrae]MBR0653236.1 hypothetical protein [Neoroseomonas terrae]